MLTGHKSGDLHELLVLSSNCELTVLVIHFNMINIGYDLKLMIPDIPRVSKMRG